MRRRLLSEVPNKEYARLTAAVRRYVSRFWLRHGGRELATFRHVARRFSIKLEDVEALIEDCGLMWNCGVGIQGVGHYVFENRGDCTVEPEDEVAEGFFRKLYASMTSPTPAISQAS